MRGPSRFEFLNEAHSLAFPADWNSGDREKLWLYHLHYFDYLPADGTDQQREWAQSLMARWVAENPPPRGNGWEPYPTALRMVNWIKWALAGHPLPEPVLHSLAVQARHLVRRLEYHLLGNHLFVNAKALVFAGLFFDGEEAGRWLARGMSILSREVPEQLLPDGGHFERSPMYHGLILEDLLDLLNISHVYSHPLSLPGETRINEWREVVQRGRCWLQAMSHPDGGPALFNDAALGMAPPLPELEAYALRLGCAEIEPLEATVTHLAQSGFVRLQRGGAAVLLDVGEIGPAYLPGHAHADTLSFELALFGQRVLVNSGTSCYGQGPERLRQRGTAAHNTVAIDGADSSEVWGGFRVARRAHPFDLRVEEDGGIARISCSHDGYARLPGKPVHHREWQFDDGLLRVRDTISGSFREAVARYFFHPDVTLEPSASSGEGRVLIPGGRWLTWSVSGGEVAIRPSTWHPEFGLSLPNSCIQITLVASEMETTFSWDEHASPVS